MLAKAPLFRGVFALFKPDAMAYPCRDRTQTTPDDKEPRLMRPAPPETACTAIASLLATMAKLRSAEGCPWDRRQTPASLKSYIIEEAYEVLEAIDSDNPQHTCEELGDLLLQVVFQAQMFDEQGHFDFADIATGIDRKLKRRHPHIFSRPDSAEQTDWDSIKKNERRAKGQSESLDERIPRSLPALQRAGKLASLSRRENLTFSPSDTDLRSSLMADMTALCQQQSVAEADAALGELLYRLASFADLMQIDAEDALRRTVNQRIKKLSGTTATTSDALSEEGP